MARWRKASWVATPVGHLLVCHGGRARFYGHIDTSGDDLMMKARAMIVREIADGLWS
ncbi:hypothetical protein [Aquamicrobium sp.]|uniref:hypothetical protein n=1 Tax=Aquamicrobium sp. TaxID=1872579 RepID=UPI00258857F9|nr:hypothetical protein [Aquamicrobium sp.]MCK9553697.1 hypothetical protein [Aquamicrobium sp.]